MVDALAGAVDREERQARLMADLRAQRERWDAEARRLGLDGAERAEDRAWRRVEELTGRVARVPARSVGGVVAKLAVAVMLRETYGGEATEFPWPILGAALDDLRVLAGA